MAQSTPINMIRRGDQMNIPPPIDTQSMMPSQSLSMPMMSPPSTSIDMGSSDSQLVEDILKEMGESPGIENQSNINSQALHYAMDSAQVPPNKYIPPSSMAHNNNNGSMEMQGMQQMQNDYTNQLMNKNMPNGIFSQFGLNLNSESLKDKIMNNIKYPILVFAIAFLISLPEFNRFLFGFFPKLLLESGQVSIGGVLLKALLAAVLYAIISCFL